MGQVSWRASDELIETAKRAAAANGMSLNAFLGHLVALAVLDDPSDLEGERLRRRFRAAGILAAVPGGPTPRPGAIEVRAARRTVGRRAPTGENAPES